MKKIDIEQFKPNVLFSQKRKKEKKIKYFTNSAC